ncbi:MAG TPA: DoxX family protein [Gemmatimonadales bacterium]|nr:DoxX family protein [Gemmatimonadales bacterium]
MTSAVSQKSLWIGRGLSAIAVLFLLFDSAIKVVGIPPVVESFTRLGIPVTLSRGIGVLELACLAVYVIPRTAIPGAILLTGFLGGAILAHVRVGDPLFSHILFPTYIGAFLWGGLLLRRRLRGLVLDLTAPSTSHP